jgi:hypothetical protein
MERSTNNAAAPVSHQKAHAMVQSVKRGLHRLLAGRTEGEVLHLYQHPLYQHS